MFILKLSEENEAAKNKERLKGNWCCQIKKHVILPRVNQNFGCYMQYLDHVFAIEMRRLRSEKNFTFTWKTSLAQISDIYFNVAWKTLKSFKQIFISLVQIFW